MIPYTKPKVNKNIPSIYSLFPKQTGIMPHIIQKDWNVTQFHINNTKGNIANWGDKNA